MKNGILIAEAGSTKTTWTLFTGQTWHKTETAGINPAIHNTELIEATILKAAGQLNVLQKPQYVHYYGAGCANEHLCGIVEQVIRKVWPNLKEVSIESDLVAAALGSAGKKEAWVIILGTGSNAAYFKNAEVQYKGKSLGYLLGDEAGGVDLGKEILKAYLYNTLPEAIKIKFDAELVSQGIEQGSLVKTIYSHPRPNQFIASWAKVLIGFEEDSWVKAMLIERIDLFIDTHLILSKEFNNQVYAIGSVANWCQNLLSERLSLKGFELKAAVKDPMQGLVEFYSEVNG